MFFTQAVSRPFVVPRSTNSVFRRFDAVGSFESAETVRTMWDHANLATGNVCSATRVIEN
jgi:hypothetical protein